MDENTIYCVDIPGTALTNNEGTAYVGTAYTFQSKYSYGQLWMWGGGASGTNATNNETDYSSPVQIPGLTWSKIRNTGYEDLEGWGALKTDGTRWMWGINSYANFGDNSRVAKSSPVQVPGTTWGSVFAVGRTATFWVKTDGTLWVNGQYNNGGLLGQNSNVNYSSPVQIYGGGTNWGPKVVPNVYAGGALKTDGTLWTWGSSAQGTLGLNQGSSNIQLSSPTQVPGTTWSDLDGNTYDMAAVKSDGTLWTWGVNSKGQLGLNNQVKYSSPTQIPGTTWANVHVGKMNMMALKTDGTLWAWGWNEYGVLAGGLAHDAHRSSPVQIPGTTWSSKFSISSHALATKTDGTLWAWGNNSDGNGAGYLGLNNEISYSSPVQIGSDTTWSWTALSSLNSGAIKTIEG